MTKITVDPGACGFVCRIEVEKKEKYTATVRIQSRCKQVGLLANHVLELNFMDLMKGSFSQNPIVQAAGLCRLHPSCPVPCALTKAVESELGMAVKKDITMTYEC